MSYDLCYWRDVADQGESPQSIYHRLCECDDVESLAWIPVIEIEARFRETFPTIQGQGTDLIWEGDGGTFQVSLPVGSKPKHALGIIVHCSFSLENDQEEAVERITDVAESLGCGCYNPQTDEWWEATNETDE
jgi:hypothetical protein